MAIASHIPTLARSTPRVRFTEAEAAIFPPTRAERFRRKKWPRVWDHVRTIYQGLELPKQRLEDILVEEIQVQKLEDKQEADMHRMVRYELALQLERNDWLMQVGDFFRIGARTYDLPSVLRNAPLGRVISTKLGKCHLRGKLPEFPLNAKLLIGVGETGRGAVLGPMTRSGPN